MKNAKIFLRMDAAMKQRLDDEATRHNRSTPMKPQQTPPKPQFGITFGRGFKPIL
jgi:hypothetical protein